MAKKAIHKIVRYSLLILALVVAGLLIAPFFIDVNDYKSRFEQEVENATGRQLSIGEVHASLFPWVGVRLEDVHLANREGFSSHDFLSVKRLHIKLALLPLLNRELEIKKFEIEAPKIFLERHADGQSNWQDFVSSSDDASASAVRVDKGAVTPTRKDREKTAPMLAALTADSLQISGGELTWLDTAAAKPVRISGINLTMDDVQLEHPFPVSLSASVAGNEVQMNTQIGPLGDLSRLDVQKLPVQGEIRAERLRLSDFSGYLSSWPASLGDITKATATLNIRLEQHPDGVRISEGEVLLSAAHELAANWKMNQPKADRVELRRSSLTVDGKEVLGSKGRVQGLLDKPHFQIRFFTPELTRVWLAGMIPELATLYAGNPSAWKHVKLNGLLAGDARHLDIRDLQLSLNGELVQVSGAVIYQRPDIRLRVTTGRLNLDPWFPKAAEGRHAAAPGTKASNMASGKHESVAEPDLRFLKSWRVTAKVQADALSLHGLNMKNFQMNVTGNNGVFDLNPMRFNLSGGLVEEKASLNVASFPARWKESVHVTGVRLEPVLKSLVDMDMLEGTLAMDTSFKARGLTEAALATLNGRGKVLLRDGKIRGFDIAGALRRLTRPGAVSGPQETDFAQLSGSFTVSNGVATNKDLFMASPLLRVTGHGVVNLVQKQLDYHVKPRVVGTLTGQGDRVTLRKGLTVPLHISGSFTTPKIRPEVNAKTLIENAPALLNKKGNLGGALGAILGGKGAGQGGQQQSGQSSQPPKESQPTTPEKQLQDAIGGLLRGL